MKRFIDYIDENRIDEGVLDNLLSKLGAFLTKKFSVSDNTSKELEANLSKENDTLNSEISKVSKGRIKDLNTWWKLYCKENKNANNAKSPVLYSQAILKNTGNASMIFKKMIDSYQSVGILNNTIVCIFIKTVSMQYIHIIESIVKDNAKKLNIINQLTNVQKVLNGVKISDNEDGEKFIKDAASELGKAAQSLFSKYKK